MKCKKCDTEVLPIENLCFFYTGDKSVNLTVKHEHSLIVEEKNLAQNDKISCPNSGCHSKLGSYLPLGPLGSKTWNFGSQPVTLAGESLKRKERWHDVYKQPIFDSVSLRNLDNFFGYQMTSETNSPKRPRLEEASQPIVFPNPQNPPEFSYEDVLMSDRNPYDYQITSYIEALQRDLIVVLPTNYGKTLIASLVAAKMKSLNPDYMVLFIVDRIPLVFQQGESISFDTHLQVYLLTRESHNIQKQRKLLNGEFDVLVSTAGAYLAFQGKLGIEKFCYIIFDECHHATKEHDYVKILNLIKQCDPRPRILGLTASPPSCKGSQENNINLLSAFKSNFFKAPICHNLCLASQEKDDATIEMEIIDSHPNLLQERIKLLKGELKRLETVINGLLEIDIIRCGDLDNRCDQANLTRVLSLDHLCFSKDKAIETKVHSMKKIYEVLESNELLGATYADNILENMDFYKHLTVQKNREELHSSRLSTLLNILSKQEESKIIIFVQTRKLAQILWTVLKGIDGIDNKYSPQKIVGQYGALGMSWENEQEEILKQFSRGNCNLLVSTSVLEEGLDVPCCDVVIRFDGIKTLTSYKQSRGRARRWEKSKFILILSERERDKYDEIQKQERLVKNVLDVHFTDSQVPSNETMHIQSELSSIIKTAQLTNCFAMKSSECAVEMYLAGTHDLDDVQESIASFFGGYFLSLYHIELAKPDTSWKSRGIFPNDSLLTVGLHSQSRSIYERYKQLMVEWTFSLEEISQDIWTRTEIPRPENQANIRCKWPIKKIIWGKFNNRSHFMASQVEQFNGNNASLELIDESHLLIAISSEMVIEIPLISIHRFLLTDWRKGNVRFYIPLSNPPEVQTITGERQTCDTNRYLSYFGENPVIRITIPYNKSNWSQLWVFLHTSKVFPAPLFESRVNKVQTDLVSEENLLNSPNYWKETMQDCVWQFSILKANRNVCVSMEVIRIITKELFQAQIENLIEQRIALSGLLLLISDVKTRYFVQLEHAYTEQLDFARKNPPQISYSKCKQNYCYVQCAMVTPSRVVPLHPLLNQCNRLYRKYPEERFLNLAFREENGGELDKKEQVLDRVKRIMENGISINGVMFYFLVCSSSQLRSKRAIFIHIRDSDQSLIQRKIQDMRFQLVGNCDIINDTKFLSRLGLFCTSDQPTIEISQQETHSLPDKKAENGLLLTDGAGKIKRSVARRVLEMIDTKSTLSTTSSLQVRLAGLKGVLTIVDDDTDCDFNQNLQHCKVLYRQSMRKIEWTHSTLCIVKVGKFNRLFLNVQMLNLLTSLEGEKNVWNPNPTLRALYSEALIKFARIFTDTKYAQEELESHLPDYIKRSSVLQPIDALCEPFFLTVLRCIYTHNIKNLIEKVHIPIPVEDGCLLMGIPDPIGVLGDGEVFITYQDTNGKKEIIEGRILTYKNPCLHPGDLLTPTAVDTPELRHLNNVIVFPIKGSTSLPACSGGGDLDGDEFAIIWNPQLIPPESATHPPLNYEKIAEPYKQQLAKKSAATRVQDDPDIQHRLSEGYCRVVSNDLLGIISHYHLAICDQKVDGARDPLSIELAKRASLAVDSPKTGIIPEIPPEAKRLISDIGYPDFMEKKDNTSYRSTKLLGDFYHSAREICYLKPGWISSNEDHDLTDNATRSSLLTRFNIPGYLSYIEDAQMRYFEYSRAFQQIMLAFGIETEAEVVTSLILHCHPLLSADKDKTKNCLEASFVHLTQQFREIFHRNTPSEDYQKKAAAWYLTVYQSHRRREGIVLHSFAWLVPEYLCEILADQQQSSPIEMSQQLFSAIGASGNEYVLGQREFLRTNVESKLCVLPIIESAIQKHISRVPRVIPLEDKLFHILPFGSTSVYLCELQSDLDLSIVLTDSGKAEFSHLVDKSLKHQRKCILQHIQPAIYNTAIDQSNKLAGEVPFISFTVEPKNKKQYEVSVDITFKSDGVQKSEYIKHLYRKSGGVFFAWFWLLVHWARHVGILKCHTSPDNSGIVLTAEFEALVLYIYEQMGIEPESRVEVADCSLDSLLNSIEDENNNHMLGLMLEKFFWQGHKITSAAKEDIVYTWPIEDSPTHSISAAALERISTLLFQGWHSLVFTRDVSKLFERVQTELSINKRFSRKLSEKIKMSAEYYRESLSNLSGAVVKIQNSGKHILLTGYGSANTLHKLSAGILGLESNTALTRKYKSNANRYMMEGCVIIVMANSSQNCNVKLSSFTQGCSKFAHVERTKSMVICADQESNTNWECEGLTMIKSLLCDQLSRFPANKPEVLNALRLKTRIGFFYVMDGDESFKLCGNSMSLEEFQKYSVKELKYRKDVMSKIEDVSISNTATPSSTQTQSRLESADSSMLYKERRKDNKRSCIPNAFCPGIYTINNEAQAIEAASVLKRAIETCGFKRIEKTKSYTWRIEVQVSISYDMRFNLDEHLKVIDVAERPIIWLLATIVGDRRTQDSDKVLDLRLKAEAAKPLKQDSKLCQSIALILQNSSLISLSEDGSPLPCESIKDSIKFIKKNTEASYYECENTLAKISYGVEYCKPDLKLGRHYCELNLYHSNEELIQIVKSGKNRIRLQELADKALKLSLAISNSLTSTLIF